MRELRDYQLVARDFLRGRDRAGLFLDMGLGKTATTLSALEPRHLPALVGAPKRVAENVWPKEASLWRPDLRVALAAGAPLVREGQLSREGPDLFVIGRDNLRDVLKISRRTPFRTLIVDELSGFKSYTSVRWKAARKAIVKYDIAHVWGLTGTPTPNGYLDLWSQIALLDGGARLGKNITTYRRRYFTPGRQLPSGTIIEWNLRSGAKDQIQEAIADLCISMDSADYLPDLPPRTDNTISFDLPPRAARAYKDISATLVADLRDVLGGSVHTAKNAAVLASKLAQITAGFVYPDAEDDATEPTYLHDEKLKLLQEIREGNGGSPLLVFYRFLPEKEALLAQEGAFSIEVPGILDDWDAGRVPMLVAHPQSAGHGLNLQYGGHTIVWTSLPWSLEEWEQANARLARQGQTKPVVVHILEASKTVDVLVARSLTGKAVLQDDLLAYLESPL